MSIREDKKVIDILIRKPSPTYTPIDTIEASIRTIVDTLGSVAGSPLSRLPPMTTARLMVELDGMRAATERMLETVLEHTGTEN